MTERSVLILRMFLIEDSNLISNAKRHHPVFSPLQCPWTRGICPRTKQQTITKMQPRTASNVVHFVAWLTSVGETKNITSRQLRGLYWEFIEVTGASPVTDAQLFRQLPSAGVKRYRETTGKRRWLYRVSSD